MNAHEYQQLIRTLKLNGFEERSTGVATLMVNGGYFIMLKPIPFTEDMEVTSMTIGHRHLPGPHTVTDLLYHIRPALRRDLSGAALKGDALTVTAQVLDAEPAFMILHRRKFALGAIAAGLVATLSTFRF